MTSLDPLPPATPPAPAEARMLRRLGLRLLGNPADADDVAQEALVAAYLHDGERVRDRGAWLRGVTRNLALQRRRSERRRQEIELRPRRPLQAPPPELDLAAGELARALESELGRLPDPQARAVRGRYLHERSYEALAREEGVASATIRTRVRRGLLQLRDRVDRRLLDHLPAWLALDLERGGRAVPPAAAGASAIGGWMLASPLLVGLVLAVSMPNLLFGDLGREPRPESVPLEPRHRSMEAQPLVGTVRATGSTAPRPARTNVPDPVPPAAPPPSTPRLEVDLAGVPAAARSQARAWVVEAPPPACYTGVEAGGAPDVAADADGRLVLPELRPGQALLVRAGNSFGLLGPPRDERMDVYAWLDEEPGRTGWTGQHGLRLTPSTDVALEVVDPAGRPWPGARARLVGKRLTWREGLAQSGGTLLLRDVPLDTPLSLTVSAPGAGTRVFGPFRVEADPGPVAVVLRAEHLVEGRVLGSDGRPVAGAQVVAQVTSSEELPPFSPVLESLPGARRALPLAGEVLTDDAGRFTLGSLGAAEVHLGASRRRLRGERILRPEAGSAGSVELVVAPPEPRLAWRVRGGAGRREAGLPFDVYASRIADPFGWREYVGVTGVGEEDAHLRGLVPGAWIVQAVPERGPGSFVAGWVGEGELAVDLDPDPLPARVGALRVLGGAASELGLLDGSGRPVVLRVGRERWSSRLDLEQGRSARIELPARALASGELTAVVPAGAPGTFLVVQGLELRDGVVTVDLGRGEPRREVELVRPGLDSEREALVACAWTSREGEVREWLRGEVDRALLRPLLFESLDARRGGPPAWRLRGLAGGSIGRGGLLVPEGGGSVLLVEESGRRTHEVLDRGPVRVDWR